MKNTKPANVEEYINATSGQGREKLMEMRNLLKDVAPYAKEGLKWGKPVFETDTILFAYSAHKTHISFIPTGPAIKPFHNELSAYIVKKDSIQFDLDKPLPVKLIRDIAEYRKEEVERKGAKWKY
jgi:uncharacterized protein YdhG (YjbR/CyaY superfamily)